VRSITSSMRSPDREGCEVVTPTMARSGMEAFNPSKTPTGTLRQQSQTSWTPASLSGGLEGCSCIIGHVSPGLCGMRQITTCVSVSPLKRRHACAVAAPDAIAQASNVTATHKRRRRRIPRTLAAYECGAKRSSRGE
jgi:hypothetical protein